MNIAEESLQEIHAFLAQEKAAGNEFVAYWVDEKINSKDQLYCCKTLYDAHEYCYEQSTDLDYCGFTKIDILLLSMEKEHSINKNHTIMDTENFEYLKNQLRSLGFGEKLFPELEQQLLGGAKSFNLHYPKEDDSNPEASLNFKRSEKNERGFFNSYDAKTTTPEGEVKQYTFYRDKGITIQEAEKLLNGESIYKQLRNQQNEPYDAKLKLVYNKEQEKFILKHTYGKSLQREEEKLGKGREEKKEQKQEQRQERNPDKEDTSEEKKRSHSRSMSR